MPVTGRRLRFAAVAVAVAAAVVGAVPATATATANPANGCGGGRSAPSGKIWISDAIGSCSLIADPAVRYDASPATLCGPDGTVCEDGTLQGQCINPVDPLGRPVSSSGSSCPRVFCPGGSQYRDDYDRKTGEPIMKGQGRFIADGCSGDSYDVTKGKPPPPDPPVPGGPGPGRVAVYCLPGFDMVEAAGSGRSISGALLHTAVDGPDADWGSPAPWASATGVVNEIRLRVLRDRDGGVPVLLRNRSPQAELHANLLGFAADPWNPPHPAGPVDYAAAVSGETAVTDRGLRPYVSGGRPYRWRDTAFAAKWLTPEPGAGVAAYVWPPPPKPNARNGQWLRAFADLGSGNAVWTRNNDGRLVGKVPTTYGGELVEAERRSRAYASNAGGTTWSKDYQIAVGSATGPTTGGKHPLAG